MTTLWFCKPCSNIPGGFYMVAITEDHRCEHRYFKPETWSYDLGALINLFTIEAQHVRNRLFQQSLSRLEDERRESGYNRQNRRIHYARA